MGYEDRYWDDDDRQVLLGDFEGVVLDSFWSTPRIESKGQAQFDGADTIQLYWHVKPTEVYQEWDNLVPDHITVQFGIGEGWETDEDGVMVSHTDDPSEEKLEKELAKPIQFKGSSLYGKFLGLCSGKYKTYYTQTNVDPMVGPVKVLDDGDKIDWDLGTVRSVLARKKANPRDASIWKGVVFRFRGVGLPYRQDRDNPRFKVLPVAFIGEDQDAAAAYDGGSAGRGGTSSAGQPSSPRLVAETLPGASAELVETITGLVDSSETFTLFRRNTLNLPEVKADSEIKAAVMNETGGPWSVKGQPDPDEQASIDEGEDHVNPGLAAEQAADEAS